MTKPWNQEQDVTADDQGGENTHADPKSQAVPHSIQKDARTHEAHTHPPGVLPGDHRNDPSEPERSIER